MGILLKKYLEEQHTLVTVSGRKDNPREQVQQADIVFVSVPISEAPRVITRISKYFPSSSLMVDLSSIKSETVKVLKKTKLPALAIHQLFGPAVTSLYNQKIVFCRVKNHPLVEVLKNMFEHSGAQIVYMDPKQHDIYMAHIQALTHFINITLARTLLRNKIGLGDVISTPVYLAQLSALMRVVSQDPNLLAQFQLENSYYPHILKEHIASQVELLRLIEEKNYPGLIKQIDNVYKHLKPRKFQLFKKLATIKASAKGIVKISGKVAYLGPGGTFSHQVALMVTKKENLVPLKTIYDIFDCVADEKVNFGIVPAENSSEGTIRETLDFLNDFDLRTCGAIELHIHHNLLSKEKSIDRINKVISHSQALAQCRSWLKNNLPKAEIETSRSTISAIVEDSNYRGVAFIGSNLAAEMYRLNVLAKNIEDNPSNFTKFYIISKEIHPLTKFTRTLLFLSVFNRVGILKDILTVFANNGIDLTRLESRPSRQKLWDYHFFIEVDIPSDDPRFVQSLNILRRYCPIIKVLGET